MAVVILRRKQSRMYKHKQEILVYTRPRFGQVVTCVSQLSPDKESRKLAETFLKRFKPKVSASFIALNTCVSC